MKIYASAEDYLETILVLKERLGFVRSIDIAGELGYSKPSVSVAMKKLRENNYIETDADGHISLTEAGMEIAQKIYSRHRILMQALIALGVSEEVADADACKLEHSLSDESFGKIRDYFLRTQMK